MTDTNLAFAKLVANPAPTAWSQAYDAGRLFAVISLEKEEIPEDNPDYLNILGKDVLATLEQEFFTLENKDLDSIKQAIGTATGKIDNGTRVSFAIVYLVGNILYLFIFGTGKVLLKRGSKIGTILDSNTPDPDLKSASGYLQNQDLIIIETERFSKVVSQQALAMALDHDSPSDIAENLAPNIHEKENGGAAALFIHYKEDQNFIAALEAQGIKQEPSENSKELGALNFDEQETKEEKDSEEKTPVDLPETQEPVETKTEKTEQEEKIDVESLDAPPINPVGFAPNSMEAGRVRKFGIRRLSLPHSKKLILTVAVIILIVFVGSVFLAIKNRDDNSQKALFTTAYQQAEAKYNEGENLVDLNKSLANDSFISAAKILNTNKDKFSKNSSEEKQILALLSKVNNALSQTSGAKTSEAKAISLDDSALLSREAKNPKSSYFTQDGKNFYFVDSKGIEQSVKSSGKTTLAVSKDSSWKTEGGLGAFLGNLYLLDKTGGIVKFVSGASTFTKATYFASGVSPDLSNAKAIAIDGSIYILFSNGKIQKYNKGTAQTFTVSGVNTPFSSPTRIWTDADATNIYVLDNGNSRVVVLGKDGSYKSEYPADVIKNATDFEVLETSKKINILSGGKAYSISL